MLTAPPRLNRMERISVRTTKKVKKVVRREWTPSDVKGSQEALEGQDT